MACAGRSRKPRTGSSAPSRPRRHPLLDEQRQSGEAPRRHRFKRTDGPSAGIGSLARGPRAVLCFRSLNPEPEGTTAEPGRASAAEGARDEPSGKLELTWTNKGKALLAGEDGRYQWVPRRDRRVAEVRLLRDAGECGQLKAGPRAGDNLLIRGDALHALTALNELPEFAREYQGKVKLCYIDPPFN